MKSHGVQVQERIVSRHIDTHTSAGQTFNNTCASDWGGRGGISLEELMVAVGLAVVEWS